MNDTHEIIRSRVSEFLDNFVVVGFEAETGAPVITGHINSEVARVHLNDALILRASIPKKTIGDF